MAHGFTGVNPWSLGPVTLDLCEATRHGQRRVRRGSSKPHHRKWRKKEGPGSQGPLQGKAPDDLILFQIVPIS